MQAVMAYFILREELPTGTEEIHEDTSQFT
jgi:hypothetical protein